MVRIDFGQRTDLPPGSNMLRLSGVQIIPLPTLANQILARTFFRFRLASACVTSRWKVLSGEFRRRPTLLVKNFANRIVPVAEDCLRPERTFHGCSLMHFRGCIRGASVTAGNCIASAHLECTVTVLNILDYSPQALN